MEKEQSMKPTPPRRTPPRPRRTHRQLSLLFPPLRTVISGFVCFLLPLIFFFFFTLPLASAITSSNKTTNVVEETAATHHHQQQVDASAVLKQMFLNAPPTLLPNFTSWFPPPQPPPPLLPPPSTSAVLGGGHPRMAFSLEEEGNHEEVDTPEMLQFIVPRSSSASGSIDHTEEVEGEPIFASKPGGSSSVFGSHPQLVHPQQHSYAAQPYISYTLTSGNANANPQQLTFSPCVLPQATGNGPYRIPRWAYDPGSAHCVLFYWSGCCGNANNFPSRDACELACQDLTLYRSSPVPQPPPRGPALGPSPPPPTAPPSPPQVQPRQPPQPQPQQQPPQTAQVTTALNPCAYGTQQFLFCVPSPGGQVQRSQQLTSGNAVCSAQQFCHIGDTPFTTICCNKPPAVDVCQQPLNLGVGGASLQRWYFNPSIQLCQPIIYRGLHGNENNFLTPVDCQAVCQVNPCAIGTPLAPNNQILYCSARGPPVCPVGYFCHVGGDARTSVCCQGYGDPCLLVMDPGQGPYQLPRWYWDVSAGECRPFQYGGLRGNQNNFLSREECEQQCRVEPTTTTPPPTPPPPPPKNPCRLPVQLPLQQCFPNEEHPCGGPGSGFYCHIGATPETTVCCPAEGNPCVQPLEAGEGDARLERFFYNAREGQCQPFIYLGEKGNENNFLSRDQCELACVPNPCASGRPYLGADGRPQTCSVSATTNTCPPNYWCHLGAFPATTVCCPETPPGGSPCQLPMSTGDGGWQLDRWYYDSALRQCRPFVYQGLHGNANNFPTIQACQIACLPFENPCIGGRPALSPATGQVLFCSALNRDQCPVNFWCHLGATPETTVCCPGATNPCSVPLSPGTGNAGLARWYYNADDRDCVQFQYNGRRGNQNNFLTRDECARTCPARLCLLSIDKGTCGPQTSGRQTRYAFDRQKGQCVPFDYTGCGGNLNNFATMSDCQQTCGHLNNGI